MFDIAFVPFMLGWLVIGGVGGVYIVWRCEGGYRIRSPLLCRLLLACGCLGPIAWLVILLVHLGLFDDG
jgi:hypothetical protein